MSRYVVPAAVIATFAIVVEIFALAQVTPAAETALKMGDKGDTIVLKMGDKGDDTFALKMGDKGGDQLALKMGDKGDSLV